MLDCMNDCAAMRYLRGCQMLHAGYHQYPVKRAAPLSALGTVPQLVAWQASARNWAYFALKSSLIPSAALLVMYTFPDLPWPSLQYFTYGLVSSIMGCVVCVYFLSVGGLWLLLRRASCCTHERRL